MAIPSRSSLSRRPWSEFASTSSFTRPDVFGEALMRLNRNLSHFRVNYALISLTILFLSLLFHPISLIIFLLMALTWYYLYFSGREEPVRVFRWEIGDGVVLTALSVITLVVVGLTGVWLNVAVSAVVSLVVVCVHGVFRSVDDLYCDEDEGCGDGLLVSVVGSPVSLMNRRS
ncbi:unnamed protein product [Rhodiola kirilowii]